MPDEFGNRPDEIGNPPDEIADEWLSEAFDRYRTELSGRLPGGDLHQVRTIARRRVRNRSLTAAAVAALVLITPAAALAISRGAHQSRPARDSSASVSERAVDSPASRATPVEPGSPNPAPDGRISTAELTRTIVDLPAWGNPGSSSAPQCKTRRVRLSATSGTGTGTGTTGNIYLGTLVYGDVDGDGAGETTALLDCPLGNFSVQQVVVFDRDPDGDVVVLGQVVRQGAATGQIKRLYDVELDQPTGGVGVHVSDRYVCCSAVELQAERQQRWYTWDGSRFRQTDGPTSFHPAPTSFGKPTVTTDPVALSRAPDGTWSGTAMVRLTNPGSAPAPGVRVELLGAAADTGQGEADRFGLSGDEDCATEAAADQPSGQRTSVLVCHLPELAAGGSGEYRFTVKVKPAAASPAAAQLRVSVGPEQPGIRLLAWGYAGSQVANEITPAG